MKDPLFTIEEIDEPAQVARGRAQDERIKQNSDWLQAHWDHLIPQARGKFIAVAGQQIFIAETPAEAWTLARNAHPEDDGAISQYVFPEGGPRLYAHLW